MSNAEKIRILSPATGQLVPLDQVPDPVFSQKIIGDGIAVIPSDETIVSPVDGEVVSVAETLHAYGFRTKEGVELLIHIGLETVALKGACFKPLVKVGDQVKAGTPVAEVDLNFLKEKELNPITPILICGGAEGLCLSYGEGSAKAGETEVLVLSASAKENPGKPQKAQRLHLRQKNPLRLPAVRLLRERTIPKKRRTAKKLKLILTSSRNWARF